MEFSESEEEFNSIVCGGTYSKNLKPDELFCCSETKIKVEAKSEATFTYELDFESDYVNDIQENEFEIVGPVFNINIQPEVVSEVHLPYRLSLEGRKGGTTQIRCGHVKDGKCIILKPVTVNSSHIIIKNASCSGVFFALSKFVGPQLNGKVLLYSNVVFPNDLDFMEYKFHLYVVPTDRLDIKELDKKKEDDGFKNMKKPHQILRSLYTCTDYAFRVQPCETLCPEYLQIRKECKIEDLPVVEVIVDRNAEKLLLSLLPKRRAEGSTNVLWKAIITGAELREIKEKARASVGKVAELKEIKQSAGVSSSSVGSPSEHFVDEHYAELVQRIVIVEEVLDEFKMLTREQYKHVTCETTSQNKMRALFSIVGGWGNNGKDKLLDALKKTNKQVIDDLERH